MAHVILATPDWTTVFPQVFRQEYFNVLPPHRPGVDLDIELEDGAKPYRSQLYPMPKACCAELQKWIDENLATGHIYCRHSPWASPLFFKKENDKLQPVVDYKELNKVTKKKAYPLLLIQSILN